MTSTTKTESKSPARTSWPTKKPRLNRRGLVIHIAWCGKKAGYSVFVAPLENIIVTPLSLSKGGLFDLIVIFSHSASVPP